MKLKNGLTIHTGGKKYKGSIPDEVYNKIKESKPVTTKKATDGNKS